MNSVILTGMPGCGKSTCGVLVAKSLCLSFTDTDLHIQSAESKPLQEIINTKGNDYFADLEERVLLDTPLGGSVIATGGSAVYSEKALRRFKENGTVIYLKISYEEMLKRLGNISTRGILLRNGESLQDMYNERSGLYEKFADTVIDCTGHTTEQTVQLICNAVKK